MVVVYGGRGRAKPNAGVSGTMSHVDLLSRPPNGLSQNSRQRCCVFYSTEVWFKSTFFAWKKATTTRHSRHLDVVRRDEAGKMIFCSTFLSTKYNRRMMEHPCLSSSLIVRNGATCFRSLRIPFEDYALRDIPTFSNSWTQLRPMERYTS